MEIDLSSIKTRFWDCGETKWERYGANTCYSPCLNDKGVDNRLTYCNIDYYIENDYVIVEFKGLVGGTEIPEITGEDLISVMSGVLN